MLSVIQGAGRAHAPPKDQEPVALVLDGQRADLRRETTIFEEGQRADNVYQLISGSVRISRILRDGRRQIEACHFPGDIFGMACGVRHVATAQTLSPSIVRIMPRAALEALAAGHADVAARLLALTTQSLHRSQDHVSLLARRAACERMAGLLIELAERTGAVALIEASMTRQDMADYLALTIETVSRCLSQFQQQGLIALPGPRQILLLDRAGLARLID